MGLWLKPTVRRRIGTRLLQDRSLRCWLCKNRCWCGFRVWCGSRVGSQILSVSRFRSVSHQSPELKSLELICPRSRFFEPVKRLREVNGRRYMSVTLSGCEFWVCFWTRAAPYVSYFLLASWDFPLLCLRSSTSTSGFVSCLRKPGLMELVSDPDYWAPTEVREPVGCFPEGVRVHVEPPDF